MRPDIYHTISEDAVTDTREKASKFIAFAYAVQTELQVEQKLEMLWKLHPKATHICYAYRLGSDQNRFRMVDDGEPSNTAGKPIYGQILSHDVTDVVVFVVRYYGGTKLGASGLIAAYKDAASEVLTLAGREEKREMMRTIFTIDYAEMGQVLNALKWVEFEIGDKSFGETATVEALCGVAEFDSKFLRFRSFLLGLPDEMINDDTEIPYCKITSQSILRP